MTDIVLDRIYNSQDLKVNFLESEPCFCASDFSFRFVWIWEKKGVEI